MTLPIEPPADTASTLAADVRSAFSSDGALARRVKDFRARPSQVDYAEAVRTAIESGVPLVAEAGTGTGKTFGYLVPAMLAGGKVIVSTATKTLQDQLYTKDVPTVRDALGVPIGIALLKGRANYVCLLHLERHLSQSTFAEKYIPVHLKRIARWAKVTGTGDRGQLDDVPETSQAWAYATSTRENCVGSKCTKYADCFVMKARKAANEADLVVVNHHLFFADVMLRDEGVTDLLPSANTVIFDEAHHLPDIATLFFGKSISSAQMLDLARDARLAAAAHAKDYAPLPQAASALEKAARDLRLVFSITPKFKPGGPPDRGRPRERIAARELAEYAELPIAMEGLDASLAHLIDETKSQMERSDELEKIVERAEELRAALTRFDKAARRSAGDGESADPDENPEVHWAELYSQAVAFNTSPLRVGPLFRGQIEKEKRAWVFTSATLSLRGDFAHYQREMGLDEAATAAWESPFDYENNSLLYVPQSMPEANAPGFTDAVVKAALPVIIAAGGRAFVLATSLRAMNRAGELLREALKAAGHDFPVLVQGEASKLELLARFRKAGNAVLVASQSFWEGVDVKGDALSLVVIDKLPFAVPDDPLLVARMEHINRGGGSAFFDLQLPQAVITLKQGVGRLIRDEHDRGVLMICDTRLVDKSYGKRIWRSLPPFRRTREESIATAFWGKSP